MANTTEEKIQSLMEIIKKQQHELDRQAAVNEIVNIMNRYEYLLGTGHLKETVDLFALKTPGVRAEMMWGVYDGVEGIKKLYFKVHKAMGVGEAPGGMAILTNTTHVIEVAGDGKTAKAVWICPGLDTGTYGKGGKPKANWGWAKRAADFVKEDGKWKIWHYHVYGLFMCPFETPWTEVNSHPEMDAMPPELSADKPPTTHWFYSPEAIMKLEPVPPKPYNTFNEKTAY